jgi:hypothetical protein
LLLLAAVLLFLIPGCLRGSLRGLRLPHLLVDEGVFDGEDVDAAEAGAV